MRKLRRTRYRCACEQDCSKAGSSRSKCKRTKSAAGGSAFAIVHPLLGLADCRETRCSSDTYGLDSRLCVWTAFLHPLCVADHCDMCWCVRNCKTATPTRAREACLDRNRNVARGPALLGLFLFRRLVQGGCLDRSSVHAAHLCRPRGRGVG